MKKPPTLQCKIFVQSIRNISTLHRSILLFFSNCVTLSLKCDVWQHIKNKKTCKTNNTGNNSFIYCYLVNYVKKINNRNSHFYQFFTLLCDCVRAFPKHDRSFPSHKTPDRNPIHSHCSEIYRVKVLHSVWFIHFI